MMRNREESPKFFKQMLVDFMDKTNYTCDIVTFDELTAFINDLQWSEDQKFLMRWKKCQMFH